ncbi:MAG: AEC family transporter [Thermoleophilia bacterium]|nr:AEC family transporter [Thermoleophilia bacterium]MDH3724496.1 AEC family transporter [Thermoleophilia bacterium]
MTATALGALFIILVGVVLRRAGLLRQEDGPALVRIVLYAALPALVFLILIRADLDAELALVPVAAWLVHGVMLATCFGLAALWSMDRPLTGAFVTSTAVGNTGFFGLPLIAASGAGVSLPAAVMYDALGTGIMTFTTTVVIASAFGERGSGAAIDWERLGRALSLPPMWALAIGIAVNLMGVDTLPMAIERPLELLSAAVLPLVMLYAGLIIDARDLRQFWAVVTASAILRLGMAALVGLGVGLALGLRDELLRTVVLMAAMPTAMMSLVIGSEFKVRYEMIAGAVLVTTLLSTMTLPLIRSLLT